MLRSKSIKRNYSAREQESTGAAGPILSQRRFLLSVSPPLKRHAPRGRTPPPDYNPERKDPHSIVPVKLYSHSPPAKKKISTNKSERSTRQPFQDLRNLPLVPSRYQKPPLYQNTANHRQPLSPTKNPPAPSPKPRNYSNSYYYPGSHIQECYYQPHLQPNKKYTNATKPCSVSQLKPAPPPTTKNAPALSEASSHQCNNIYHHSSSSSYHQPPSTLVVPQHQKQPQPPKISTTAGPPSSVASQDIEVELIEDSSKVS